MVLKSASKEEDVKTRKTAPIAFQKNLSGDYYCAKNDDGMQIQ